MIAKQWVMIGALSAFFGVLLGAFGGHVLKEVLDSKAFSIYLIGVQYQMIHALALIGLGVWASQNPSIDTHYIGLAFTLGIVIFSGSLYGMSLTGLKFLGILTPVGGLSFLAGWLGFAYFAWRS